LTEWDAPAARQRYYVVTNAQVLDVAASLKAGAAVCSSRDVALVGLHIMIRTKYRPQWIWSSFEHVDNVAPAGTGEAREPDAKDARAPYSYFDPSKPPPVMTPDIAPPPVSAANPPKADPEPTQVVRKLPIHPDTMATNRAYWAMPGVQGTVWANYMLVATQWPTEPQPVGPQNDGRYFPGLRADANTPGEPYQQGDAAEHNLANTTMETYAQSAPSSCMACHHVVSNALGRDFVAITEFSGGAGLGAPAPQSEPRGHFPAVGVVKEIDPVKGYLTIAHEEIKGLMPSMEMTFRVEPRALVEGVRKGDRIEFTVDSPGFVIRAVKARLPSH
jgi:Cu/Ag efflux protein CusF